MPPPPDLKNALLREIEGSVLLKVRAVPGSARERVAGLHGDALKVCVAAPPEKGKANEAIARLLARKLGLKASRVSIHSGNASRDKWIRLEGLTAEAARKALERLEA